MSASWRHPFLAPLYAAVISFVFVVLFGSVLSEPPQPVITGIRVVTEGSLPPELAGLPIEIRNRDGANEIVASGKIDNQGSYTPEVPVANHLVCIQPKAPWTVTEQPVETVYLPNPVTCTKPILNPPDRGIVLKLVKGATVRAMAEGQPDEQFARLLVQIREADGVKVVKAYRLDDRGRLALPQPVGNQQVCLQPPPGWMVTAPPTTGQPDARCAKAPGDAVDFTLRPVGGR